MGKFCSIFKGFLLSGNSISFVDGNGPAGDYPHMILRYHIIVASIAVLSLMTSGLFAVFTDRIGTLPAIILIDIICLGLGGYFLSRRLYRPLLPVLQGERLSSAALIRLRKLPEYTALALLPLIFIRWLCLTMYELNDIPADHFEGGVVAMRVFAEIWWMVQGAIYYPIIVYFAVSDYVADLRRHLFDAFEINIPPRNKRLRRELSIVFAVLATLPLVSVLFDVLFFSPARLSYGIDLASHIVFDVLMSLLAVLIAIYFIMRDLTRPIVALRDAVGRVSDGDLESHSPIITDDEIGQLANEFNELIDDLRERDFIKETFGKYVSPAVVPKILEDKGRLEGETRTATMIFTDIEGFTSIVEDMTPKDTIDMLNEYFGLTLPIIRNNGGVINAMIGDAIFAAFNVPVDDPRHAELAIESALQMQEALEGRTFANGVVLNTRCGINTGLVVAGSVGSKDRMNYTLLGDEVNVAARVEQMNKQLGSYVLVTESTYRLAKDLFIFEDAGDQTVKGKLAEVHLFKVMGRKG